MLVFPIEFMKSKILRLSIIVNPGFTMFFAGIALATYGLLNYNIVFFMFGFLSFVSLMIGFVLLTYHIIKDNEQGL